MKKRLTALLLVMVMVLGMLPTTAFAASSEEEALGEVNIYNGGQTLSYLSINGRIRELVYTYFNYVDRNGNTKEIPAYCVNPNTKGVPQTVAPGESIKYLAKEKGSDPKVMGIIANGYPTRGLSLLKLENKYHAYYATKMALWCYLLPNWNINDLKVNPNLTGVELQRAQAILAAAKDIYVRGTAWNTVHAPRVTATPDRDTAYDTTVDGQQYKQQVFTVHSDTWVCNYTIRVAFTDPASVPTGTRIVDMDNNDITTITTSATGGGYAGKFKILYPASAVAGKTGSVQLSFTTDVYQYAVFYAVCAEQDKYGQLQNYMCDTDPTVTMRLSAYSNYGDGGDVEEPDTGLKITKLETGTDTPLSGAIFEVVDPEGDTIDTFATGSDGTVTIPLMLTGNYTVYERVAPLNHLLSDTPVQNIKVELYHRADTKYNGRLPVPVRVLQDEWANVAQPESYPKILATCRSYNIGLNIIVQNIQQIKALYEKEWESIVGNCDTLLFLGGGNEPTSLEFFVKLLGKETIATRTRGQTKGRSGSSSTNFQQTGRELMTQDEIATMDGGMCILQLRGVRPFFSKKVGEIAADVGATPQGWNSGIFNMIRNLSESVIIPIAGAILAFVMTYELIQMVTEKNNLHDDVC